jgi:hypothetical protein
MRFVIQWLLATATSAILALGGGWYCAQDSTPSQNLGPSPTTCVFVLLLYGSPVIGLIFAVVLKEAQSQRALKSIREGRCVNCGYDVRLITSNRCPECGSTTRNS